MSTQLAVDQYKGRKNIVDRENGRKLGEEGLLEDTVLQDGQMHRSRSAMNITCRIVQYSGSGTLSARDQVSYDTDQYGTHVNAEVADGVAPDGIVDPFLTKTISNGDTFLLFTKGPCEVTVDGAVAGPFVAGAGSAKAKTATLVTAGRFGRTLEDGTGKADGNTMRVYLLCEGSATL